MNKEKLLRYIQLEITSYDWKLLDLTQKSFNFMTNDEIFKAKEIVAINTKFYELLDNIKSGEFDNEIPKSTEINNIIKKRKIIISNFYCDNCGSDDNCDCKECLTDNWGLCRVHSGCMCEECDNE